MILTQTFRATQPKSLLDECNRESGRIYTRTMVEHWRIFRKHNVWLSQFDDMHMNDFLFKETTLHAHSRDAAQEAFAKAVKTTHALRQAGFSDAEFPHKIKYWKTTSWKNTGIRVREGVALLARARGLDPIYVPLPFDLQGLSFVEARLVYNRKTSHYEWHFVTDDGIEPLMRAEGVSVLWTWARSIPPLSPMATRHWSSPRVNFARRAGTCKSNLHFRCKKIEDEARVTQVSAHEQGESKNPQSCPCQTTGYSA